MAARLSCAGNSSAPTPDPCTADVWQQLTKSNEPHGAGKAAQQVGKRSPNTCWRESNL